MIYHLVTLTGHEDEVRALMHAQPADIVADAMRTHARYGYATLEYASETYARRACDGWHGYAMQLQLAVRVAYAYNTWHGMEGK